MSFWMQLREKDKNRVGQPHTQQNGMGVIQQTLEFVFINLDLS